MIEPTAHLPLPAEEPRAKLEGVSTRPEERVAASKRSEPAPAMAQSSRSRLAYDQELARVFVEIVDPDSGEVVERFPPEELVKHMQSLIEQEQSSSAQDGHGLLLDRVV
jgi:hypothetical protein